MKETDEKFCHRVREVQAIMDKIEQLDKESLKMLWMSLYNFLTEKKVI